MIGPRDQTLVEHDGAVSFWPGLIDLVTSALMVFLLISFIRTVLDMDEVEALVTRGQQARFLAMFEEEFLDEIDNEEIAIERHLSYLQITFSDKVLFASGKHHLEARERRLLDRCARLFAKASDSGYRQIQVEGHTDSQPVQPGAAVADNWELSTARALAVVRFLIETGELPPEVFSANGYADQQPVVSNRTSAGRAKNRRIEIRLFFALPRGEAGTTSNREVAPGGSHVAS